jgi:hypothetical protein
MLSYVLRALPDGLILRAKQRARADGTTLDAVLLRYLETYAEHGNPQAKGARAVNASRTPQDRRDAARRAAQTRWDRVRAEE